MEEDCRTAMSISSSVKPVTPTQNMHGSYLTHKTELVEVTIDTQYTTCQLIVGTAKLQVQDQLYSTTCVSQLSKGRKLNQNFS